MCPSGVVMRKLASSLVPTKYRLSITLCAGNGSFHPAGADACENAAIGHSAAIKMTAISLFMTLLLADSLNKFWLRRTPTLQISDRRLPVGKGFNPSVDADARAHAVHPERIVLEDLANLGFILRLDDPESAEWQVGRDFSDRACDEHLIFAAIQEREVVRHQFLAQLAHTRLVLKLNDKQHSDPFPAPWRDRKFRRKSEATSVETAGFSEETLLA